MASMGNSRSGDSGNGLIQGPNSISGGSANEQIGGYVGIGVTDGQIDSVLVGGSVGKIGGGFSYDGDEIDGFFNVGVISGSYDPTTGAMEGGGGNLVLTGRVGYDGQGTGYLAGDVLSYEVVRLNWSENPDFVPDAQHGDLVQEHLLAQTEAMREEADGVEPYLRDTDRVGRPGRPDVNSGDQISDFPEQGARYEGELEWFGGFPTFEEALSDPVPASALVPSSAGVPESVLSRVDDLVEEYGYTEAQARDEVRQEMFRTSPAENYGDNDALDGDGTEWVPDEVGEWDPATPVPDGIERPQGDFTGGDVASGGDAPELEPGAGAHPGGEAARPGAGSPANDGNDRQQGNFTGEEVSPSGEVPELEPGRGEHAAGEVHETQSEAGSGAAAAGFGALGRALATESGVDGATETAALSYSVADGFQVTDAGDAHGGNGGGMASAAQRAGEVLDTLIEATGRRLKDSASVDDLTIGYSGEHMTVNGRAVGDAAEGVEVLVEEALAGQAIEGGDAFIKRALYRQIEAGETVPAALADGEIGADDLFGEALLLHWPSRRWPKARHWASTRLTASTRRADSTTASPGRASIWKASRSRTWSCTSRRGGWWWGSGIPSRRMQRTTTTRSPNTWCRMTERDMRPV